MMKDFGAVMNVSKPIGKSSFAVVSYIRKLSKIRKVGHAGTLDPAASGVLLIALGKATKKVEQLMNCEKEYIGSIQFGYETDSYDNSGKMIAEYPVNDLKREDIENALRDFRGEISQVPPVYSALKHNGQPLYEYARKGEPVIPDARMVHVRDLSIEYYEAGIARIRMVCSRGTYVRSIAHDLGLKLGCGAVLCGLTRVRVGEYLIKDAAMWDHLPETVRNLTQN